MRSSWPRGGRDWFSGWRLDLLPSEGARKPLSWCGLVLGEATGMADIRLSSRPEPALQEKLRKVPERSPFYRCGNWSSPKMNGWPRVTGL